MLSSSESLAPDGKPYRLISLCNQAGMQITLMDWGATWLSARIPLSDGDMREALLGCAQPEIWTHQNAYLGASVGRYANRIANSQFTLNGHTVRLVSNQGPHQLHGGPQGFDKRRWQIIWYSQNATLLYLHSPAGDQGFPGELGVFAVFFLLDDRLEIDYQIKVSAPCPVNITNHAYFNLDGKPTDIRQHQLQLCAQHVLPVDESGIPTGDPRSVADTSFDFRQSKPIGQDFLQDADQRNVKGYDHGFLLDSAGDMTRLAACLRASDDRLQMRIYTNTPALQFYTGNHLQGTPARHGGIYQDWQGLALESGFLADSPNHPHWPQPDCIVTPGHHHRSITQYQFIAS